MGIALVAEHVSRRYGRRGAVDDISFVLEPGITGLVGSNGAGKSTLLELAAGFVRPTRGYITLVGVTGRPRVGYVPQSFGYPRDVSIEGFVEYAAWVRGLRPIAPLVAEALRAADLWDHRGQRLGAASGGVVRRAGFAAAILGRPDLLLLDEPTTGIDPEHRSVLREVIRRQSESVVVFSSHLSEDIEEACSRVLALVDGRVSFDGTPAEAVAMTGAGTFEAAAIALSRATR